MSTHSPLDPASHPPDGAVSVPWSRVEHFVGQLFHDIRNGLNACELQLTFLGEISTDPEAAEEIKSLRGALSGITKHLQAVRLGVGATTAHMLEYPAADLFEDLKERFVRQSPKLADRTRWLMLTDRNLSVSVDPELVLSACLELLANATQFAKEGSSMTVKMESASLGVDILIEQTLAEELADSPTDWGKSPLQSTRRGAYGLGLFRARRSLAAQGANLDFVHAAEKGVLLTKVTLRAVVPSPSFS